MLKLRYEYFSESYPRFGVYKIQEWEKIQHHILHEKFSKIVDTAFGRAIPTYIFIGWK